MSSETKRICGAVRDSLPQPVEIHQECVRRKEQMKTAIEAHLKKIEE